MALRNMHNIMLWCLIFPLFVTGQSPQSDLYRMNRDLRIMEGILDKLLDQEDLSQMRLPGNSRAIYMSDYGLIFYMKKPLPYKPFMLRVLEENMNLLVNQTRMQKQMKEAYPGSFDPNETVSASRFADFQKATEKIENEALENIKSGITEFLSNYVASASLLENRDKIAVLVDLDGWRTLAGESGFLTAWIDMQQAEALRQSRDMKDAGTAMHFKLQSDDRSLTKDIKIMAEIINQALATGPVPRYAATSGLHLNGLGALFFMELYPMSWFGSSDTSFSIIINDRSNAGSGIGFTANIRNSDENAAVSSQSDKITDELFDLMASYGHTLCLEPGEQIIFEVDLGPKLYFTGPSEEPSAIRMQLSKQDIDDYNHGKMSLKELKRKLKIHTL
jgi:hypothetical protein